MRVASWNMGRAMDAFADVHERAWHFLVALGADIALVQEAIPPDWIRELFQVHAEPFDIWGSAVLVRPDWPLRPVTPTAGSVLAGFGAYLATAEVTAPGGQGILVGSVHTTAKAAFARQLAGLDADAIRRPSVDVPWMNDLAHFGYRELVTGRRFIIGGDWNTSLLFDSDGTTGGREFYDRAERDGWIETNARLQQEETQTWLRQGNRPHMLDHVFCDAGLAKHLVASRSMPDVISFLGLSDHAPLIVDFDLDAVAAPRAEAAIA